MCKLQCTLAFILLAITSTNSWDIAITAEKEIEFYDKGIKVGKVEVPNAKLTALAYDAVYNLLLFVDKHSDNASIFSYNATSQSTHALVRKKSYEQIEGVTFDPLSGKLFWTDIDAKKIYYKSLKENGRGDDYGMVLFSVDDQNPRDVAVDSCRGYIYWTNIAYKRASIMKARFDGSSIPEVVVDTEIFKPVSISIDQRDRKIYWADDEEGIHYAIWSADLDGKNRTCLSKGIQHQPNSLTVSKDSVFWIDWDQSTVWRLPKNAGHDIAPEAVIIFSGSPFGIVANYPIEDQIEGIDECQSLLDLSRHVPVINGSIDVPMDAGIYCLHGYKVDSMTCKCTQGYTGDRCEIPVCHNYCHKGECRLTADGEAKCICEKGFTGDRCDEDICWNYCLNEGSCSVDQRRKPTCTCTEAFEGRRCEKPKVDGRSAEDMAGNETDSTTTGEADKNPSGQVSTTVALSKEETCNCTSESIPAIATRQSEDEDFVPSDDCNGWDPIRDPILMLLGIICGLLCVACTVLFTKVMQLKRRPRIKKRIIVNKNVTPLTARPDQCEITIENCCNMNICETPCFEPRSTIRPTLLDAKPGKEERRNLIANMELPDD